MTKLCKKKKGKKLKAIKLTKVSTHEHNLLHLLFICQYKGVLESFVTNLESLHGGLDFADLLMEQENLTIFSAFPWAQSGEGDRWKSIKNEIEVSLQYPTFTERSNVED